MNRVSLEWLLDAYRNTPQKEKFFNTDGFTKHAGTTALQKQVEANWSEASIRETWEEDLERFRQIRGKYLLYE